MIGTNFETKLRNKIKENEKTHPLSHGEDLPWTTSYTSSTSTSSTDEAGDDTSDRPSFDYYYHFCVNNLQNTRNPFGTTGAPLICLNNENHPFLVGIADPARSSYIAVYDKIETGFDWIDGIISGTDIRKVLVDAEEYVKAIKTLDGIVITKTPDSKKVLPIRCDSNN